MSQVILLSLTASLNPTLVAATTVMLLLESPAKLMLGYLLGAYMTSITLGLVIVFSASNSSTTNTTQNTISPSVDIALGVIALIGAWAVWSGRQQRLSERRRARKAAKPDKEPPRWQRELSKGSSRTTFAVGACLTLPGASYLAGLSDINKLNYSTTETVLLVIGFNLVMLWLLEVPLLSFLVAPAWTPHAIDRAKAWVSRHSHMFAVRGLTLLGALLIIKGVVGLTWPASCRARAVSVAATATPTLGPPTTVRATGRLLAAAIRAQPTAAAVGLCTASIDVTGLSDTAARELFQHSGRRRNRRPPSAWVRSRAVVSERSDRRLEVLLLTRATLWAGACR